MSDKIAGNYSSGVGDFLKYASNGDDPKNSSLGKGGHPLVPKLNLPRPDPNDQWREILAQARSYNGSSSSISSNSLSSHKNESSGSSSYYDSEEGEEEDSQSASASNSASVSASNSAISASNRVAE